MSTTTLSVSVSPSDLTTEEECEIIGARAELSWAIRDRGDIEAASARYNSLLFAAARRIADDRKAAVLAAYAAPEMDDFKAARAAARAARADAR